MDQVFGTMTLAVSLDLPDSTPEDALNHATKVLNCYTTNIYKLEVQDVHKRIYKLRVLDIDLKWEKNFNDEGDDQ